MLSKAKGQVLRVAAALHVLAGDGEDEELENITVPGVICREAILAAVKTCCQHAAFVTGRGRIENKIAVLLSTVKPRLRGLHAPVVALLFPGICSHPRP